MLRYICVVLGMTLLTGCNVQSDTERAESLCDSYDGAVRNDCMQRSLDRSQLQRQQFNQQLQQSMYRPQLQPYVMPIPQPNYGQPVRLQTTCQRMGDFTYCN
jgi:hypothetical protein